MEWIPEKVLQKYVRDNPEHFKEIFDGKIPWIEFNRILDKYPDLVFIIDNKITIPVEVEWKTSNFLTHKHNPNILTKGIGYDKPGFLLVGKKEENVKIGNIKQFKIDLKKFEKWFIDNSDELVLETTKEIHIEDERTTPKLWMCYLSAKGNAVKNFQIGLKHEVWGIPEKFAHNTQIKEIKKSFKGYFEKLVFIELPVIFQIPIERKYGMQKIIQM